MIHLAQGLDNLRKVASEIFGSEQTSASSDDSPACVQTFAELAQAFRDIGGHVG